MSVPDVSRRSDLPPIRLAPRNGWRDEGNHDITVRCATCNARVIPLNSGICPWCDTAVAGEALRVVQQRLRDEQTRREKEAERVRRAREKALAAPPEPLPGKAYRRRGPTSTDLVGGALSEYGPQTRKELEELIAAPERSIHQALRDLRKAGFVEVVGMRRTLGCPAPVYGICTDVRWWHDQADQGRAAA